MKSRVGSLASQINAIKEDMRARVSAIQYKMEVTIKCSKEEMEVAHPPEGLYIARTLVRDCREVPVRVLNVACGNQKLMKGCPLVHCEPVVLVTPPDWEQPQVREQCTCIHT
jgi:hypothetical protein